MLIANVRLTQLRLFAVVLGHNGILFVEISENSSY